MTKEEKKQIIEESKLQGKIVVEFRESGMGVSIENAKPYQVVIAAITLLNQGITTDQCDNVVNIMESVVPLSDLIKALENKTKETKDEQPK